jgi:hypothetical protein
MAPLASGIIRSTQVLPVVGVEVASKKMPVPVVEVPKKRVSVVEVVQPEGPAVLEAAVGQAAVVLSM